MKKNQLIQALLLAGLVGCPDLALAIGATWTAGNGDYGMSANWDILAIPCNEIVGSVDVVIPGGARTIDQDVPLCSTDSLLSGDSVVFNLLPNTSYTTSFADIAGHMAGTGGDFTADAASLSGTTFTASATLGSVVTIPAPMLNATGFGNLNITILSAANAGSVLDLSGMTHLDGGFGGINFNTQIHTIEATDGGIIDLSDLTSVTGAFDDEDRLDFHVTDTAQIDLSSLSSAAAQGQVRFVTSAGGALDLPALSSVAGGIFSVTGGSAIDANNSSWTYSSTSLTRNSIVLMNASDAGSVLDLSGMTELNAGFAGINFNAQTHTIQASNSGVINLSGLTSVTGAFDDEDRLDFHVTDTAQIVLSSLDSVTAQGQVRFLTSAGGALDLPALSNVAGGIFSVTGGSAIDANNSSWTYSSTGLTRNSIVLMNASDAGSVLDLSGMTELNAGFAGINFNAQTHTIQASNSGVVNLSGLTSVTGPFDDEDRLDFSVTDTAQIDLSSLSSAAAQGQVRFVTSAGATLDLPVLNDVSDGVFSVSGGSTINASDSSWLYSSTGLTRNSITLMHASDPGSVLDLSGMTELNAGFSGINFNAQVHTIEASNGGLVDLSGLDIVRGPLSAEDRLRFVVGDGTLVIGPLNNVSGNGSESLEMTSDLSQVIAPRSLKVDNDLTVSAVNGATLSITGDFSFLHVDETRFDLEMAVARIVGSIDGAEPRFEVGGFDYGAVIPPQKNFGFAQLILGPDIATDARLFDGVDNDNNHDLCVGGGEALYLYGPSGPPAGDGLVLENGSTLNLNGVNLYAAIGGVLMHINPLATPGVPLPFSNGFILAGPLNDMDSDGVDDDLDNCVIVANPDQRDTDTDGYGNFCDPDIDNPTGPDDGIVNFADLTQLRSAFFTSPSSPNWNPDADFNGDDFVNFIDLEIMRAFFFIDPGPSCVAGP